MGIFPPGLVYQRQLHADIKNAIAKLGPEAVHVSYSVEEDSTGDPSLFFRVVLTDEAAQEQNLLNATQSVSKVISSEVHPLENWGLFPYFNFRSYSEWKRANDPEWAA
jgi:hypothetical protein